MFREYDYIRIMIDYLPKKLRNSIKLTQFLGSLLKPIRTNSISFTNYTNEVLRDIKHNSQIIYFDHYINNYSLAQNQIYIISGTTYSKFILELNENLGAPVYLYEDETDRQNESGSNSYMFYSESDGDIEQYDYAVVIAQSDFENDEIRNNIISICEKYRIVGSTYKILIY